MLSIEQAKISVNELGGLLLQSLATAPIGADGKNFEYSISQPLDDMTTTPTFGQATMLIQSALSKVKPPALTPGSIPSNVEMVVQAIRPEKKGRYLPPQLINNNPNPSQSNPKPASSKFSVKKATFYQGKHHNKSLKARFGYACLYCRETGHWYANCSHYWHDVQHGLKNFF